MRDLTSWLFAAIGTYLEIPTVDLLKNNLPSYFKWGEFLPDFMQNVYAAIGILFLLAAFVLKLVSIKKGRLENKSIELEHEAKLIEIQQQERELSDSIKSDSDEKLLNKIQELIDNIKNSN